MTSKTIGRHRSITLFALAPWADLIIHAGYRNGSYRSVGKTTRICLATTGKDLTPYWRYGEEHMKSKWNPLIMLATPESMSSFTLPSFPSICLSALTADRIRYGVIHEEFPRCHQTDLAHGGSDSQISSRPRKTACRRMRRGRRDRGVDHRISVAAGGSIRDRPR